METLQEQLAAVQARLNSERELGGQKDADKIAALEVQEADLTRQIMEQAQQERVQAQEEKVAAITLPHDFNAVFDDQRANEIIIELIQQYKRQAYAEHNEEMAQLSADHKEELRAAADRELQLQRQNGELQEIIKRSDAANGTLLHENGNLRENLLKVDFEKDDALSRRDASVRELEAAKAENSQLKEQLANVPAPKVAIDVSGTDKLAQLVKESNEAKALRGLARWNNMLPEIVTAPVLPFLDENSTEVPAEIPSVGESFRTETEVSSGLDSIERGTDQGVSEVTRVEFEELKSRVDILFANKDRREVA